MRTRGEYERDEIRKAAARRSKDGVTPQHSAAAASLADGHDDGECEERDGHVHVAEAEMAKAFRDAYEPPAEYPRPIAVHPEDFRKGPIREGHDAVSPGYEPPLSYPAPPRLRPSLPDPANLGGDCA